MSLAIPEPVAFPDLAPDRTARALRRLRLWQVRNTLGTMVRGSRLRISMILFCSRRLLGGPVRALPGRVPVRRTLRRPGEHDHRVPLQHVLPVAPGDALLLDRNHRLHHALPLAGSGLPAHHAGLHGPDLRLQVRRGGRLLELGLLPPGQSTHGGLWSDQPGARGVLPDVPALHAVVRPDSRRPGSRGGDHRGQRLSPAAEDRAGGVDRGGPGGGGVHGRSPLADPGRRALQRLAGRHAQPAGLLPESALAQPVDVRGTARRGQGAVVAVGLLPDVSLGQRRAGLPAGRRHGPRPLPPRLQPSAGGPVVAPAARAPVPRRRPAPALLVLAPADPAA